MRDWAVEDGRIANKQPVDSLSLDQRRDTKCSVMHDIVLGSLHSASDPLLLDRVANIELSATLLEVPGNACRVESIGCCVDPIRDVTLD